MWVEISDYICGLACYLLRSLRVLSKDLTMYEYIHSLNHTRQLRPEFTALLLFFMILWLQSQKTVLHAKWWNVYWIQQKMNWRILWTGWQVCEVFKKHLVHFIRNQIILAVIMWQYKFGTWISLVIKQNWLTTCEVFKKHLVHFIRNPIILPVIMWQYKFGTWISLVIKQKWLTTWEVDSTCML